MNRVKKGKTPIGHKVAEKWGVSSYWCFLPLLCEFICSRILALDTNPISDLEIWHGKRRSAKIEITVSVINLSSPFSGYR